MFFVVRGRHWAVNNGKREVMREDRLVRPPIKAAPHKPNSAKFDPDRKWMQQLMLVFARLETEVVINSGAAQSVLYATNCIPVCDQLHHAQPLRRLVA